MKARWILILVLANAVACAKSGVAKSNAGGSSDGGGQLSGSTREEVEYYLGRVKGTLKNIAHRARAWKQYENGNSFWNADVERIFTDPSFDLVVENMKIVAADSQCVSADPNHVDGSANIKNQTICLSIERLMRIGPNIALRQQTFALAVHEVFHLMGADEWTAELAQRWIIFHPLIADVQEDRWVTDILDSLLSGYRNELQDAIYLSTEYKSQLRFCRKIAEFKGTISKVQFALRGRLPYKLFDALSGTIAWHKWEENLCYEDSQFTDEKLAKVVPEIEQARMMLRNLAHTIVDYDTLEKRHQWYVDKMK